MTTPQITVRDIQFDLDAAPRVWHGDSAGATAFFDAMSIAFPQGERVFIRSVMKFKDQINDAELLAGIEGFKSQEAMHTREHENYNRRLRALGYDVDGLEAKQAETIEWAEKELGDVKNLAITVAMEHFTSILAEQVTGDPSYFEAADPAFRDLWTWHAMEEAEHNTVAFDVLRAVSPGYFLRCQMMLVATRMFLGQQMRNLNSILKTDGNAGSFKVWSEIFSYLYVKPGFARRCLVPYLKFFIPGFHPSKTKSQQRAGALRAKFDARARKAAPASG